MKLGKLIGLLVLIPFAVALSGCGDTWQGLKKDTGDNMEAAGEAVEDAGKKVKE